MCINYTKVLQAMHMILGCGLFKTGNAKSSCPSLWGCSWQNNRRLIEIQVIWMQKHKLTGVFKMLSKQCKSNEKCFVFASQVIFWLKKSLWALHAQLTMKCPSRSRRCVENVTIASTYVSKNRFCTWMFEKQQEKNVSSYSLARNKTTPPLLLWMFKANGDKHHSSRFNEEDQSGRMVQGLMLFNERKTTGYLCPDHKNCIWNIYSI